MNVAKKGEFILLSLQEKLPLAKQQLHIDCYGIKYKFSNEKPQNTDYISYGIYPLKYVDYRF